MKPRLRSYLILSIGIVMAALSARWWLHSRADAQLAELPAEPVETELNSQWRERVTLARRGLRSHDADFGSLRELARLYHANRRHLEARQCYELLLKRGAPLSARDHYHIADVELQLGEPAKAIAELKKTLEQEAGYTPARAALSLALLKSGNTEEAKREFEALLAIDPLHIEATLNLARLELQVGQEAAALNRLERLVAARPESTSAVALLAQLLARRGEHHRAEPLIVRSQQRPEPIPADPWMEELDPYIYDPGLLGLRFEEHAQAGDEPRALRFLSRLEELQPHSPLGPMLQGSVAARARRHEVAVAHFRTALARGGDPEKLCPVLVASLLALDAVDAALELLERYRADKPESIPLLVAHSEAIMKKKDRAEARAILTRALELQPYLQAQAFALAEILWTNAEYDAAAPYLERVAQADARHLASRALLAEHSLRKSNPDLALQWLIQAEEIGSRDDAVRLQLTHLRSTAHVQKARLAVQRGVPREALHELALAAELVPDDPQIYADRAKVFAQMRDYEGAANALEKLSALQPDNPTVLLSLGDLRRLQGRTDVARQHWKEARRLAAGGDDRLRSAIDERLAQPGSTEAR